MAQDFSEALGRIRAAIADGRHLDLSGLRVDDPDVEDVLGIVEEEVPLIEDVDLSHTYLTRVPDALWSLRNLTKLNLSWTRITTLPGWLGDMDVLKELDLRDSAVADLPHSLAAMTSLSHLWLSSTRLGDSLERLRVPPSLTHLHMADCDLVEVPSWVWDLRGLVTLDLRHNKIESVSSFVGQLGKLKTLWLDENRLGQLPCSIGHLPDLADLSAHGNPLSPELMAAVSAGGDELLNFMTEVADDAEQISEAKLVLVGEGAVGKSSLLSAMRGEPFVVDRQTTHGVEIKTLEVAHEQARLVLNCWDFGGQPAYRPTHQLFFSKPAVYLVVWKPREGPDLGHVDYWISLIKDRTGAGARIHVVATHCGRGRHPARLDRSQLLTRFGAVADGGMIAGFHHIDSESGLGVAELKQAIAATSAGLEHLTRWYPRSWLNVLTALSESDRSYLRYERYQEVAARHGLSATSARSLARNSHALGQIIYYDDDPALRDVVVLKADWLSVAISFVLEDETTARAGGLLPHRHLPDIWASPSRGKQHRYPHELQQMFLRLMERFDLTYRAPDLHPDDPTSLVTQLLQTEPPESLTRQWDDYRRNDMESVQICQFVEQDTGRAVDPPPGLMARLIVLFHRHSLGRNDIRQSVHWLRGVVLEDRYGDRALLMLEGVDLLVRAKGVNPNGFLNQLVRQIREYVEGFWKGRRTKVQVPCPRPCGATGVRRGRFDLDTAYRRLSMGKSTVECRGPECAEDVAIVDVLALAPVGGHRPNLVKEQMNAVIQEALSGVLAREIPPMLQMHTEKVLRGQRMAAEQVGNGLWEVGAQIGDQARKLYSQVDQRLSMLMRALDDEALGGPRLFSMEPVDRTLLRPGVTKYRMRLTLWCEHSWIPVPLLEPDQSETGMYTVEIPRDWWTKAAPLIKTTSTLLKAFLPIGLPVIRANLDDQQWKSVEERYAVIKESLTTVAALGADVDPAEGTDLRTTKPFRAEGGLLRMLHAILREQDATFGNLRRVRDGQRIVWVHPRFERIYAPEPPRIPT